MKEFFEKWTKNKQKNTISFYTREFANGVLGTANFISGTNFGKNFGENFEKKLSKIFADICCRRKIGDKKKHRAPDILRFFGEGGQNRW